MTISNTAVALTWNAVKVVGLLLVSYRSTYTSFKLLAGVPLHKFSQYSPKIL